MKCKIFRNSSSGIFNNFLADNIIQAAGIRYKAMAPMPFNNSCIFIIKVNYIQREFLTKSIAITF